MSFLNKVTHRSKTNIRVLYVSMTMSLKTSYEPYTNTSSRTRKLGRPGKTIFQSLEFEHLKLEFKLSNSLRLESWIHASIVNTVTRQMELFSLKVEKSSIWWLPDLKDRGLIFCFCQNRNHSPNYLPTYFVNFLFFFYFCWVITNYTGVNFNFNFI